MEANTLFSKDHLWVKFDGNTVKIGLSEYALTKMKAVVFLNLPEEGDNVSVGEAFGDVESLKTVSDLISPVDGVVKSVNSDLADEPEMIGDDPMESWLIMVEITNENNSLMNVDEYAQYCEGENS